MVKVKIFGAGSIGNHLANAAIFKGWDVTITDIDSDALSRTKNKIYPSRYGKFNTNIKLFHTDDVPKKGFDWIFIGTPPDTHVNIALSVLDERPKAILIEKPFSTPDLKGCQELYLKSKKMGIKIFVGYDHIVAPSTNYFLEKSKTINNIQSLDVYFREHWEGIFNAHPWLSGPEDTYLGFWKRGGGALGEHSHGLNLWQYIANNIGLGRVKYVQASLKYVENRKCAYDKLAMLHLITEKGFVGNVIQDVITKPALKFMRLQGDDKSIEWQCRSSPYCDVVKQIGKTKSEKIYKKNRPDDFINELDHLENILATNIKSPISIEYGLETMLVIAAAHKSSISGKKVTIDYNMGYIEKALLCK